MSATDAAKQALARRSGEGATLLDLIERQRPQIERALPAAIGADRFARIVTTEIRRNPALLECAPESVLGALMLCAQLGLEPGPLGHAYLVPYGKECTFILGYKGMIELARRSDRLGSIRANIVYEGEPFALEETERGPKLRHTLLSPEERGKRLGVYCAATIRVGPRVLAPQVTFVWPQEVEAARKRSPAARRNTGPWVTDEDAMWRKTAVRRASPWLPMTATFAAALDRDDAVVQGFDASGPDVIDLEPEDTETDKEKES